MSIRHHSQIQVGVVPDRTLPPAPTLHRSGAGREVACISHHCMVELVRERCGDYASFWLPDRNQTKMVVKKIGEVLSDGLVVSSDSLVTS
jgi:hypothetical protein